MIAKKADGGVDQLLFSRQLVYQRFKVGYSEGFSFSSHFMNEEKRPARRTVVFNDSSIDG